MVLRYGYFCPLNAHGVSGEQLLDLLTFARYSLMEMAIIAINLKDGDQTFYPDLTTIKSLFSKVFSDNTVVVVSCLLPKSQSKEYFFLREFFAAIHFQTLFPYSTSTVMLTVCPDNKSTFQFRINEFYGAYLSRIAI